VTEPASLDDLRWHFGEAYPIELLDGRYVAQRRDSHATMSAGSPDQLLGPIRADYTAHPVPRDLRPCRFVPERG
jgi:hypothetical protein